MLDIEILLVCFELFCNITLLKVSPNLHKYLHKVFNISKDSNNILTSSDEGQSPST